MYHIGYNDIWQKAGVNAMFSVCVSVAAMSREARGPLCSSCISGCENQRWRDLLADKTKDKIHQTLLQYLGFT